ncbi:truncated hemoglobin YjbI/quinol monooxygenase YgiN [Streptomyces griseochromogenes]|uniref:Antibiotic biosynthesis monooxygenase n=1 Tax=Streptomyces griseochromogenes TaxID=68214 RepID=A0A1B1ARC5_9ACTN|nr:antibiotic biosynthesis monooxygenase [Streptomyces griseochromogenes]ANP49096.1 antibiotic biosynthesis monooxygenase [Streptomyces griseochromogenes]MBP2049376.1 truncated hemoglobin YjbI/quinol monooxygenase YgiN [Streptomyces griseochromogenes]
MTAHTIEYIRYRIPEQRSADFLSAYTRAAAQLAAAPQCVDYELTRCEEDPEHFVLRITWTSTRDHLEGFRTSERFPPFLAEIRPYVEDIEEMRHYDPTPVHGTGSATPTLYDWAGGAEAFSRLTDAFYDKVLKDDLLAPLFQDLAPDHAAHVALWLGEVFGGPARYSETQGGHGHMVAKHVGKHITEPQRRRWVNLVQDAADDAGLPTDAEFRSAFLAYVEWGTRLAVYFSGPNARPPAEQPVPRWNWGAMSPYQG